MTTTTTATRCRFISNSKATAISNPRTMAKTPLRAWTSTPFDLVLLDVMMPKVDGYQVLTWIKEQPRLRELPVIMISALNEMRSVIRCIELGAVDYLLKPFIRLWLLAPRSKRSGCGTRSTRILPAWKRSSMRRAGCKWPWCRIRFPRRVRNFQSTCVRAWSRLRKWAETSTIFS